MTNVSWEIRGAYARDNCFREASDIGISPKFGRIRQGNGPQLCYHMNAWDETQFLRADNSVNFCPQWESFPLVFIGGTW